MPSMFMDPGEIVGKNVQRHLGGDLWQRLHQEVRVAPIRALIVPEGMLDRLKRRWRIFSGMLIEPAAPCATNSRMCSCSHRLIRRSFP